jgi:hypothetical protein
MLLASAAAGCGDTGDIAPPIPSSDQSTASPVASPTANPSPTPLAQPLHVPLTTPVILFHDPVNPDQVDGITWDGTASGRVASGAKLGFTPNPAGTLYATLDRAIYDRSGHLVGSYGGYTKGFGTWADDERHYCQMVGRSATPPASGEPATLQLGAPGETTRTIVQVGTVGLQATIALAACSVLSDRAIVVQSGGQGIGARQLWVVQLSTGHTLWTRSYLTDSSVVTIGASRDGQYITEAHSGTGQAPGTTVYSPTGAVVGHIAGAVAGFSWDGTLAVVTSLEGSVSVIRWGNASHVWGAPQGQTLDGAMAEPGGQRVGVSLHNPDYQPTTGFTPTDLYVIGSDGQATPLLQKVLL